MEEDAQLQEGRKADALLALVKGPLAASAARVSAHSRALPSGRDFHFYRNFDQFRAPAGEVATRSKSLLGSVGSSPLLLSGRKQQQGAEQPVLPEDLDDAHDWLVNLNDEILERFSSSMDEFKTLKEEEEGGTGRDRLAAMEGGGFQMVYGKKGKKKKDAAAAGADGDEGLVGEGGGHAVKVASRDKKTMAPRSQVPFHIPTIPRPQDEYKILANNSNQPFDHVWLERSEDGGRFVHPLEKLSVLDFIDMNIGEDEPVKPPPIENTPFNLVEGVKELRELAAKLRNVGEFAVDLEHNHYRSFQGITCLMQISTRTEDFIIDTLKLRVHVGPHLREVFKDPSKRKVIHGADRDILWLQRDFGIYVCNLFDTGQASRILQLERNSLEFLLHYFCGFTANKEYQQADWRLRPLPEDMLKYAREDTHYLLYIYDMMKRRLLLESSKAERGDSLLAEVYKRSYDVCLQLYEKELLTDTSYLRIYGLKEADFNSQQLAVVAGLCEWRDNVARAEDESTGYILPNKTLLEIARQMPLTSGALRRLVKSKHPYVERNVGSVVGVIRNSIGNAAAFETVSEQLKKGHLEAAADEGINNDSESPPLREGHTSAETATSQMEIVESTDSLGRTVEAETSMVVSVADQKPGSSSVTGSLVEPSVSAVISREEKMGRGLASPSQSVKAVSVASVEILKKPTSAFGALFANSSNKRKLNPDSQVGKAEQDMADVKLERIKSSVTLPFHSFAGSTGEAKLRSDQVMKSPNPQHPEPLTFQETEPRSDAKPEDVIPLANESDDSQSSPETPGNVDSLKHRGWFPELPLNGSAAESGVEMNLAAEPMSLSELSSSFRKCFQSTKQSQSPKGIWKGGGFAPLQPFDYAAARREVRFGDVRDGQTVVEDDDIVRSSTDIKGRRKGPGEGRTRDFQPARRSQAYPASGNRSATFR